MAEQVKLSYDAYSKLKTTLEKLFSDNSPGEIKKFLSDFEVLKGNPEQFSDATSAKSNLVYKNVVDSVVQIAERAGLNISRGKIARVIRGLFEEEEITKEDVVVQDMGVDTKPQEDTEVNKEMVEDTTTETEVTPKEEVEEEVEEEEVEDTKQLNTEETDSNRISELENKIAELTTEVNTLKMALKEKQIELKDEKAKNENYKRSIPNKIFAILESALPDIIEVAKQEIINSNSDIKMKCEAFDKIATIMGTESSFAKLAEAVKARNNYSKLLKTKSIMENLRRKNNLLGLRETAGRNRIDSQTRTSHISSLRERMSSLNKPGSVRDNKNSRSILKEKLVKSLQDYAEKKMNNTTIKEMRNTTLHNSNRINVIKKRLMERKNILQSGEKQDEGINKRISPVLSERLKSRLKSRIEESKNKESILSKLKEIEMNRFNSKERPILKGNLNEEKGSDIGDINPKLAETLTKIDTLLK